MAATFPSDSKSVLYWTGTTGGTTCDDLLPATSTIRTIFHGQISVRDGSNAEIWANGVKYMDNLSIAGTLVKDAPIYTNSAITCVRQSNKDIGYTLVYVDRDTRTTRDPLQPAVSVTGDISANVSSSTLTYGDLNASLFLFLLLVSVWFLGFWWIIRSIKIKKKS